MIISRLIAKGANMVATKDKINIKKTFQHKYECNKGGKWDHNVLLVFKKFYPKRFITQRGKHKSTSRRRGSR